MKRKSALFTMIAVFLTAALFAATAFLTTQVTDRVFDASIKLNELWYCFALMISSLLIYCATLGNWRLPKAYVNLLTVMILMVLFYDVALMLFRMDVSMAKFPDLLLVSSGLLVIWNDQQLLHSSSTSLSNNRSNNLSTVQSPSTIHGPTTKLVLLHDYQKR